jgi:hypothetical protein
VLGCLDPVRVFKSLLTSYSLIYRFRNYNTSSICTMDISTNHALKPLFDGIAQTGAEKHSYVGPGTLLNNIPVVWRFLVSDVYRRRSGDDIL